MNRLITTCFLLAISSVAFSQVTIFSETMGTVGGTTAIATHESGNGFDNDDFTMSDGGAANPAEIRTTSASSGYTGASGGANVFFTSLSGDRGFSIAGINTSTYTNLKLSFGYRKESASANGTFVVEWSTNGTTWTAVVPTLPAANAIAGWYHVSNLDLPAGAQVSNLSIRWIKSGTQSFRIDDVVLTGEVAGGSLITLSSGSQSLGTVEVGMISSVYSVTVSGSDLTDDIMIVFPTGVEGRVGEDEFNSEAIVLFHSGGTVDPTSIDFRWTPEVKGLYSDSIMVTSVGATSKPVYTTGTAYVKVYSHRGGEVFTYLNDAVNWNTKADSTGDAISGFSEPYTWYVVQYGRTAAPYGYLNGDWVVDGEGSRIVLSANSAGFTIPSPYTVSGVIDLEANSFLEVNNSTITHTLGTISASSIVSYTAYTGTTIIPAYTYGDLYLSNASKVMAGGLTTVTGNFALIDLTNFEGASASPFTTVNVGQTMNVQGTVVFSSSASSRITVVMNGNTAQTISGNDNAIYLFRLTVANAAGVQLLSTHLHVGNPNGGGITLTDGSLNAGTSPITFFTANSPSIIGQTETNKIIGTVNMVKKIGTGSSTMGAIGLSIAAGTDSLGTVTITRKTGSAGIVSVGGNDGIARQYTISSTLPPVSGRDLTFSWLAADDNGKNLTDGVLYKSSNAGETWEPLEFGDYSSRSVLIAGQTTFGSYTITDGSAPLPVELSGFSAASFSSGVKLVWSTKTEQNNAGFEVERKTTGNWTSLGFVAGKGTTNHPQSYSFIDAAVSGKASYRLKQVDTDGAFSYSP
ncbi:MAG: hypothetical protein HUU10_15660, partial [Bacteroidetes bacterium]|nr:hypothetical protein [Bacteroidota bacterium]